MSFNPWKSPKTEGVSVARETATIAWYSRFRVLMLAGAFVWPLLGFVSLFAFDAPKAAEDPWTWVFVAPIWAYPFVVVVCGVAAGICKRRGTVRVATILMGIPAAMAGTFFVVVFSALAYGTIVGS